MAADRLAELVVECAERLERDGPTAVEDLCRQHPEFAEELRTAIEPLLAFGLVGRAPGPAGRPTAIGEFEIVGELGRGGMGVVYEARQPSLNRTVALKVLATPLGVDEASLERFRREGANAARLQHRGIAQVFAVGHAEGCHYLAMERIDGAPLDRVFGELRSRPVGTLHEGSLRRAVALLHGDSAEDSAGRRDQGRGFVRAAAQVGVEVAEALAVAHAQGVVHRDVKPSNVMMRRDGSVVLTDFGLARHRDDPSLTRSGSFAGTPFYTSPEQAAARADIDHRTDLFSLGALLYELLTLQQPFSGSNTTEVLRNIQVREPVDPRRWNGNVPRDLVAILQRLLEKEPARRYASASDLVADLRAFLDGRPVTARPITLPGRLLRWARRQRLQAALAGTLLVGVPAIAILGRYAWTTRDKVLAAEAQQHDEAAREAILAGYIALGEARADEARGLLRQALRWRPEDAEAWAGLALVALRGDAASAAAMLAEFEQHASLVAGDRALQRCRAELLSEVGRGAEAEAELTRLGPPREALESFWVGMRQMGKTIGSDKVAEERVAYGHLLDAVVQASSARPAFLYWLAVAAGELGDEAGARRAARALQTHWPDSGFAWSGVGLALSRVDPEAAIAAYRRALELLPDMLPVRNNLANALAAAGRREESIVELREIVRRRPDYGIAHYNLGRMLFYEGQLEEAAGHLRRAVDLGPQERRSQHYLAWCLLRMDRAAESLAAAEAAVVALPQDALMRRDVARAHLALGAHAAAEAAALEALRLGPEDPANHDQLADVLRAKGDRDGARRCLERVVELSEAGESRQRAREDLARFLVGRRGVDGFDAARGLQIAEELAQETERRDPWVLELLVDAHLASGAPAEACKVLDEALQVLAAATAPDALRLREVLQQRRKQLAQGR